MRQYEKFRFSGHVPSQNLVRGYAVGFELCHELEGVLGRSNHLPVENRDPLTGILSEKLRVVGLVVGNVPGMYLCPILGISHLLFIPMPCCAFILYPAGGSVIKEGSFSEGWYCFLALTR